MAARFVIFVALAFCACARAEGDCAFSATSGMCRGASGPDLLRDGVPSIRALYLVDCDLSALSATDFEPFRNLATLHVTNCTLPTGRTFLAPLTRLKSLQIAHSPLSEELSGMVAEMVELRSLLLPWNQLHRVSLSLMSPLQRLEMLDLSHNAVEELDADAFAFLSARKVDVRLVGNPLCTAEQRVADSEDKGLFLKRACDGERAWLEEATPEAPRDAPAEATSALTPQMRSRDAPPEVPQLASPAQLQSASNRTLTLSLAALCGVLSTVLALSVFALVCRKKRSDRSGDGTRDPEQPETDVEMQLLKNQQTSLD